MSAAVPRISCNCTAQRIFEAKESFVGQTDYLCTLMYVCKKWLNNLEDSAFEIIWLVVVVVERNTFAGMDLLQLHSASLEDHGLTKEFHCLAKVNFSMK